MQSPIVTAAPPIPLHLSKWFFCTTDHVLHENYSSWYRCVWMAMRVSVLNWGTVQRPSDSPVQRLTCWHLVMNWGYPQSSHWANGEPNRHSWVLPTISSTSSAEPKPLKWAKETKSSQKAKGSRMELKCKMSQQQLADGPWKALRIYTADEHEQSREEGHPLCPHCTPKQSMLYHPHHSLPCI